jgi:hypothetical protein
MAYYPSQHILMSTYTESPFRAPKHEPERALARTPSPTPSEVAALADDGKFHPTALLKSANWSTSCL